MGAHEGGRAARGALGYDHLWVYDHVETVPRREPTHVFEAFTTLAALAQLTSTIELGQLVTCAAYRNAGLLAKEAACVDVFSGGRLILGIGAGWYEREYQAYGIPYPSAGTRLQILDETLEVVKRLWTEETVTYQGKHLAFDGAYCDPKPIQQLPEIWVGGGGEKVTLRIAAQHADTDELAGRPRRVRAQVGAPAQLLRRDRPRLRLDRAHARPRLPHLRHRSRPRRWLDSPGGGALVGRARRTTSTCATTSSGPSSRSARRCRRSSTRAAASSSSGSATTRRPRASSASRRKSSRVSGLDAAEPAICAGSDDRADAGVTLTRRAPTRTPGERRAARRSMGSAGVLVAGRVALGVSSSWTRSDLWLDEALSVNIARLPLGDLRAALQHDGAPPLYYVLLHVWTGVLGSGDVAVRSLSAVLGVGTLVACWYAARRSFGTTAAWLAIVVIATNPFLIRYATEARMYMLEMLLVACGIIACRARWSDRRSAGWRSSRSSPRCSCTRSTGRSTSSASSRVALLVVAWRDATQRRAALLVVGAIGVGLLTFIPWLPTFFSQRAHTGTPWGDPVLPGLPIGETFLGFAGGEEQEGWLLLLVLLPILGLGLLGRAVDGRHLELDLRVQPSARWLATDRRRHARGRPDAQLPRGPGVRAARTARSCSRSSRCSSVAGSRRWSIPACRSGSSPSSSGSGSWAGSATSWSSARRPGRSPRCSVPRRAGAISSSTAPTSSVPPCTGSCEVGSTR